MKRFLSLMVIFLAFYIGIQAIFKFTIAGSKNQYTLQIGSKNYKINEVQTLNKKEEHDNYYITITDGTNHFEYQFYDSFNHEERLISDIKVYEDGAYSCILPVFRNKKNMVDVTCLSNGVQYFYHSISGKDFSLDDFVSNLSSDIYDPLTFEDKGTPDDSERIATFYLDNIPKTQELAFQNYQGFYLLAPKITKSAYTSKLFAMDVYNMTIAGRVGKYYVVADYDEKYEFQKFYLVDMTTLKNETVEYSEPISFDTYIQGIIGNSMYLFDRNSKTQYELNIKTKSVVKVGSEETKIKFYQNGTWEERSAYDAYNQNLYFVINDAKEEFPSYAKATKIGNTLSGFYYLYERAYNGYHVYRVNVQSKEKIKTYLCDVPNLDTVRYVDDYLYFIDGDTVYYYAQGTAFRKVYQNPEMKFNDTLLFDVYD